MSGSTKALKAELLAALNAVQKTGSFAGFGPLPSTRFPDPIVALQDAEPIPLPLDEPHARQLIAQARQAPFGRGAKTIVDTSVRNTWELAPSQFEIRSPVWHDFIKDVTRSLQKHLGVAGTIHAELYKMLIYEKGAMFKTHTDSEKAPGMFATLVLCLPSPHQGGDIVVKHGGQERVYKTSAHDQSFACWYSDVSHEVLPVQSGYRWVLTYNLVVPPAIVRPTASLVDQETRQLRAALRKWTAGSNNFPTHFYHGLEYEYSEASISLKMLKGRDFTQVQALRELCKEFPVDIFLTVLEKMEVRDGQDEYYQHSNWHDRWDDEDEDEDEDSDESEAGPGRPFDEAGELIEATNTIKSLVDLDGRQLVVDMDFGVQNMLDDDCFADEPDETESTGFTGNEGITDTHWYLKSAVAIVLRSHTVPYLLRGSGPSQRVITDSLLDYFCESMSDPACKSSRIDGLKLLASKVVDKSTMSKMLVAAMESQQWDLLEHIASQARGVIGLDFFASARDAIAGDNETLSKARSGLTRAISSFAELGDQLAAVNILAPSDGSTPDHVLVFARDIIREIVEQSKASSSLQLADGEHLAKSTLAYLGSPFFVDTLVPIVESKKESSPFVFAFLREFHRQIQSGEFPEPEAMIIWNKIASLGLKEMVVSRLVDVTAIGPPNPKRQRHLEPPTSITESPFVINPELLADVLRLFLTAGIENDLVELYTAKLTADANTIPGPAFQNIWLPLMYLIIPILESNSIPLTTPRYQKLFRAMLTAYKVNFIGRQPVKETNFSRAPVPDCCSDCRALNVFLQDPRQKVERFTMGKTRRRHLEMKLWQWPSNFRTTTDQSGRTYTLVVQKVNEANDLERREWQGRRTQAVKMLRKFGQNKLKALLGDYYNRLYDMQDLEAVDAATGPGVAGTSLTRPLEPVAPGHTNLPGFPPRSLGVEMNGSQDLPQLAGTKRSASWHEIIDLTNDD
ncbi:hypothetical protein GQ53DRAFT_712511 [Thozetella sp. PMI_491]|nr:hypothetical protein GQ53DRAFT_712511 [Thozetella sp. PMI_491]